MPNLSFGLRIERDAVGFLRHVLADQPHAGHPRIGLHRDVNDRPHAPGFEERLP
jgi:hypothetical protein